MSAPQPDLRAVADLPMERPDRPVRRRHREPLIRAGIAAGLERAITGRVLVTIVLCVTLVLLTLITTIAGGAA